jgi:mono/diheme cytochrome c family protein
MMTHSIKNKIIIGVMLPLLLLGTSLKAQEGKTLFNNLCSSCHGNYKNGTGPALYGALERQPDEKLLKAWIKNNNAVLKSGNAYYNKVLKEYNNTAMNLFTGLSEPELDALVKYIKEIPPPPAAGAGGATTAAAAGAEDGSNMLLYGVVTLALAVLGFILLQVNSNLKRMTDKAKGIPSNEAVPFWRNKAYLSGGAIILALIGGYLTTKGAINYGRSKDYQPVQPIYYSHKVHAGVNQINCLYCHSGAEQGKHANIPSVNICMNCHKGINEYAGAEIVSEDGDKVDGTAEIQKLYKYAGYDPKKLSTWRPQDIKKPIEWIRIHNLPDHVYFNHAQHVKAGKVQCQTCHGPIQEMHEVKQYSDLSMGWCINCHRETKVQFKENNFYAGTYEKWQSEMKDSIEVEVYGRKLKKANPHNVTVEMIGGTECQKCHY